MPPRFMVSSHRPCATKKPPGRLSTSSPCRRKGNSVPGSFGIPCMHVRGPLCSQINAVSKAVQVCGCYVSEPTIKACRPIPLYLFNPGFHSTEDLYQVSPDCTADVPTELLCTAIKFETFTKEIALIQCAYTRSVCPYTLMPTNWEQQHMLHNSSAMCCL